MTISQRPRGGWGRRVVLAGAGLLAIGFLGKAALPYLLLDATALAPYASRRLWILTHITAGMVALLIGPVQLWLGLSSRTTQGHRWLGRVYVASVGVGAAAAFYLSTHTDYGWVMGTGLTGLGLAWIATTTLAVTAIRRGLADQHREWMIRSYVVTFAFVVFRALFLALQAAEVGTLQEQLAACSWFCWAVPLAITEAVLQGRKIFGPRGARDAGLRISRRPA
jgi:uncharacterized membrane protein